MPARLYRCGRPAPETVLVPRTFLPGLLFSCSWRLAELRHLMPPSLPSRWKPVTSRRPGRLEGRPTSRHRWEVEVIHWSRRDVYGPW